MTQTVGHVAERGEHFRQVADRARSAVGLKLAAYVSGADSPREFVEWVEKFDSDDSETRERLELLLELAAFFRTRNASTLYRGWLRDIDPRLGRSRATVIREQDVSIARRRLRAAAEDFLG